MSPLDLAIEPMDTLFFRDGQSYVQGEPWQADVASRFPPSPNTLIGAIRATLARSLGWSGQARESWSAELTAQLGDGDDLGPLTFRGPLLRRGAELLLPAPAALLAQASESPSGEVAALVRLRPGQPRRCDLGEEVRLPVPLEPRTGLKPLDGAWIGRNGLEAWLRSETPAPATIVQAKDLWRLESRVGIARDADTRTTGDRALYSPRHVRLARGVSLWLQVTGLSPALGARVLLGRPHPLGGEGRSVWIESGEDSAALPNCPALNADGGRLHYQVLLLTPADLARPPVPGAAIEGLPGHLVSACLSPPSLIGGWDSRQHAPLPLRPHLAAGSVLFMEAQADQLGTVQALHGRHIGVRGAWGFGWILVGAW